MHSLAAIPRMLPPDAARRARFLEDIRRTVRAAGAVAGERAERLAQVERLFAASPSPRKSVRTVRKTASTPGKGASTPRKARTGRGSAPR